jgi:hypothetical protein
MSPNTTKQRALRKVEKAVGGTMPPDVYNPLSLIPARDIEKLAEWITDTVSGKRKADVLPLDDFDDV